MTTLIHSDGAVKTVSHERWRTLSQRFLDHNYQHTLAYADALARRRHATSEHVEIVSEGETLGLASVRIRTLAMLGGGVAYISCGPLTRMGRDDDIDRLTRCLAILQQEYVERRGLILRILAPLGSPQWNQQATEAFRRPGWRPAKESRSYRTFLLDISGPPEQVRAGCSKYWRRNLRRAESKPFTITVGTNTERFEPVRALYDRLLDRKQFRGSLGADFYAGLQQHLADDEQFVITTVLMDGEPVAAIVVSMLGDTCMPLILASNEVGLRSYAVYRLQWHSIVAASEQGANYYDLGGIDPVGNAGVYNFKKGLRGLDLCAPGPFECAPAGMKGAILRGAEGMYRRLAPAVAVVRRG